jgi:hypothetical protein
MSRTQGAPITVSPPEELRQEILQKRQELAALQKLLKLSVVASEVQAMYMPRNQRGSDGR